MSFYRRNLPHYQPPLAEYFITFRIAGSLPKSAVDRLNNERKSLEKIGEEPSLIERRIYAKYDELLDEASTGPTWLSKPKIAETVCDSFHYRDNKLYDLYAYSLMPNHGHLVFKHLNQDNMAKYPVTKILQELKRFTAVECNKLIGREGQFWQHESFDHIVRDNDALERIIYYTLNNPVKAGLVDYMGGLALYLL